MDRSELETLLFGEIFTLQQHLSRMADRVFEPLGVTGKQWLLLAVVMRAFDEAPTLSQAASVYGTSRQNIKQIAYQLQRRGLVEVTPDPADKRALRIHVTDEVSKFSNPEVIDARNALLKDAFSSLSDADLTELQRIVDTLVVAHAGKSAQ